MVPNRGTFWLFSYRSLKPHLANISAGQCLSFIFWSFFLQPLMAHMTRSGLKYPLPPNIGFPFSYDLSKKQRSKNLSTSISSFWIRVTYCEVYMNLNLNIFEKSAVRVQEFSQQWHLQFTQYFRLQVWKKMLHSFLVY